MENNNLISIPEYIRISGHTAQNVYRWIREGRIKPTIVQKTKDVRCLPIDLKIDLKWRSNLK